MGNLGFKSEKAHAKDFFSGGDVVPPGYYPVVVIQANIEKNKEKKCTNLKLIYEVQEKEKRNIKHNLCITHSNETTQKIARGALRSMGDAMGIKAAFEDTKVLFGRPFEVKIKMGKPWSNSAGEEIPTNEVCGYRTKTGAKPPKPTEVVTDDEKPVEEDVEKETESGDDTDW